MCDPSLNNVHCTTAMQCRQTNAIQVGMALGADAKSVAFRLKVRRSEMIRGAKAVWHGTGRDGNGSLTTDSHVPTDTPYSFKTGFENEMAPIPKS